MAYLGNKGLLFVLMMFLAACTIQNEIVPVTSRVVEVMAGTHYRPAEWSDNGRYLLAIEEFYSYGVYRVIDSNTNQSSEIPDSFTTVILGDEVFWLDETHLLQIKANGLVQIWRVEAEGESLLELDRAIQLDYLTSNYFLNFQLDGELLRFTASTGRGTGVSALYELDLTTGELIQLSPDIDQRYIALYWSPSGQHALYGYTGEYGSWGYPVFLDDLNGDTAIEVSDIFGSSSCCWHWYEE